MNHFPHKWVVIDYGEEVGYEFKRGMKKGYYTKMAEKETVAEVSKLPFAD